MLINVVIIDDEPLARKGLKEYVVDVDFLQLVGEFDHPLKAADLISKGEVQLLLLDIQMPKITGIDFFKSLQQAPRKRCDLEITTPCCRTGSLDPLLTVS